MNTNTNKSTDYNYLNIFNKPGGNPEAYIRSKRNYYIFLLIVYVLFLLVITLVNPYGLVDKYAGFGITISILLGLVLVVFLRTYSLNFSPQDEANLMSGKTTPPALQLLPRIFFIIVTLGISAGFIYWIITIFGPVKANSSSIIRLIVNILIILFLLTLVYRVFDVNNYFTNIPLVKLIISSILYIPCLFSGLIDLFVSRPAGTGPPTKQEKMEIGSIYLLFGTMLLYVVYFSLPYILNRGLLQGGKQIIDDPVYIDKKTDISTYIELNKIDETDTENDNKYEYQYGMSFWFWVDARPPSTRPSYSKYTTILNYGNKPKISYNGSTNTLMIVEELKDNVNSKKYEYDDEGRRIIYKMKNVKLQKWNNIIINYFGGTLDIFYNGELVNSSQNVVPYMTYDTLSIGEDDGINGAVCNVIYFDKPLDYNQVYNIYNKTSIKSEPTLYSSRKPIISQIKM